MKEHVPVDQARKMLQESWHGLERPWWERRSQVIPVPTSFVEPFHEAIVAALPVSRDDRAIIAATHPPALVGVSVYPDSRTDATVLKPSVRFVMEHPIVSPEDRPAFFRGYTWLTEVAVGTTTKRVVSVLQQRHTDDIPIFPALISTVVHHPLAMTEPIRRIKTVKDILAPFIASKPFLAGLAEGMFVGRTAKLESACRRMGFASVEDICIHIGHGTGNHDYGRIDTTKYSEEAGYGSWSGIITISSKTFMLAPIYQALFGYSLQRIVEHPSVFSAFGTVISAAFGISYMRTMAGYILDSFIHEYLHYFSEAEGRDGLLRGRLVRADKRIHQSGGDKK